MCDTCGCGDHELIPVDVHERILAGNEKSAAQVDAYLASQTAKGVRPIVMDADDFDDRKRFNSRESNNRVGYSATRVAG